MGSNPFLQLLDSINAALDTLPDLPEDAHGRESGQVEYKLNEAKLWLSVTPGMTDALSQAEAPVTQTPMSGVAPQPATAQDASAGSGGQGNDPTPAADAAVTADTETGTAANTPAEPAPGAPTVPGSTDPTEDVTAS